MTSDPLLLICLHADPTQPSGIKEGGGTHAYLRELTTTLAMHGHGCHVVTRRQSPELPAKMRISPLSTLYRIDLGPPGELDKRLLNDLHEQTVAEIERVIEQMPVRPKLIHSVYWNSGRAAMTLSQRYGIPFVHTVISNGRGRRLRGAVGNAQDREAVESTIFQAAACIFSISESEKQDLIQLYGIDPGKIVLVGRPVEDTFLFPAQNELGVPRRHWGERVHQVMDEER